MSRAIHSPKLGCQRTLVKLIQRIPVKMWEASHHAFSVYPAQLMEMEDRMARTKMTIWVLRRWRWHLEWARALLCRSLDPNHLVSCMQEWFSRSLVHFYMLLEVCRVTLYRMAVLTKSLNELFKSMPEEPWIVLFFYQLEEVLTACDRFEFPSFLELLRIFSFQLENQHCRWRPSLWWPSNHILSTCSAAPPEADDIYFP